MRAPDESARERATDPRASHLVTAPAGSGKTALLAARFLRLLSEGGPDGGPCHPRRILAVTFTDKAAVEMRERIALWLRRAKEPEYRPATEWDGRLVGLARAAQRAFEGNPETLESPLSFRVSTFHSLCASIASRWPAQAEVPPGATVLAEQAQEARVREAVREAVDAAASSPDGDPLRRALEGRLAALNGNASDLSQKLAGLLKNRHRLRDAWRFLARGDLAGAQRSVRERLAEYLRSTLGPAREHFSRNSEAWRELADLLASNTDPKAKRLPAEVPACDPDSALEWAQLAQVFLTDGHPRKVLSTRSGFPKDLPKPCQAFIKEIPADAVEALGAFEGLSLDARDPAGLLSLFDYLQLAAAAAGRLRPKIPGEGLDYLELEIAALRALDRFERPSEGLIFFHETLRHVLVDEAQDLNPEQALLLGRLLEGWEPDESEHPRTLFVVGDPKQSIYRFRGSEVSLFTRMAAEGIPRPGESPFRFGAGDRGWGVRLEANFRSDPRLVDFCNGVFRSVLGLQPREDWDEVAFEESAPGLQSAPEAPAIRLGLFQDGPDAEEDSARSAEARWLAGETARLRLERPAESVAVLIPRRTKLDVLAAALREAGVPVQMLEGEALADRPEVFHLHALFGALASPFDDVAWAGALRAPWGRVSDSTLFELSRELSRAAGAGAGHKAPWGMWKKAILGSALQEVALIREKLALALEDFGREPYDITLMKTWESLGGPESVAARYGSSGVANCLAYLEIVRSAADSLPHEALDAVEGLLERAFTPPAPEAANSPVRLMTIHRAKGLEFDHVFVPQMDYDPLRTNRRARPPILMLTLPVTGRPLFAAVEGDRRTGLTTLAYEMLRKLDEGRELAESKRLLYVAATRARRGLHLSGRVKLSKEGGSFSAPDNSPLAHLMGALLEDGEMRPDFSKLGAQLLLSPGASEPRGPFKKPALEPLPAPMPFEAAPAPYRVRTPSESPAGEEDAPPRPGEDDACGDGEAPRIEGVVIHRLLETLARRLSLPPPSSVVAALSAEGMDRAEAKNRAEPLLEQAAAAWEDAAFVGLRAGAELLPEWPVEQADGANLWVGRLDLVIEGEGGVFVVDYKTSRPAGGGGDAQRAALREHYATQLARYVRMLGAHPRFAGKPIRAFLLLTAFPERRLVEVNP